VLETSPANAEQELQVFRKDTLCDGKPIHLDCVRINGQTYCITGGLVKIVSVEKEWYEDVHDPASVITALIDVEPKLDIFTFWQRVPETEPKYQYYTEWESLAVLPIKSFDYWWNKQAKGTTRNIVRKSQKAGVEVREAAFDDDFVQGMVDVFNDAPVRQGRRFLHYGKDFETVKRQFSRFLFREVLIGAYYQGELIGFAMVADAGRFGVLGQFISKFKHRDKGTNNALMAKTVETCERRQLSFLTYGFWGGNTLVDFKRHSGFEEVKVPRYFVPLTPKGQLALKLGLHRGWGKAFPDRIRSPLKKLRKFWYGLKRA
jgi:hypothetical protein